jgi:glutamyl-tRNA synthetase
LAKVRVRFAPSPTGDLHIGGARTALFNWLFARKKQGTFVLRIDDTDLERSTSKSLQGILDSLNWLGLDWDEGPLKGGAFGPYYQSERREIYQKEIERLLKNGKAYYCFCSAEELAAARDAAKKEGKSHLYSGRCRNLTAEQCQRFIKEGRKPVVRLRTPKEGLTVVEDLIRGKVSFENNLFDDFILLKSNKWPTYNFASVVDDYQMQISHVIRAEEHLSNTPKQILIARALGYPLPGFAHVPMILAPDRSKLSKRHGAISVEEFRKQGYLPEAMINYLALLGWSPPGEEELFSIEQIIADFSLEQISKTAAIYDLKKLTWMNGHYLRKSSLERIVQLSVPYLQETGYISRKPDETEHKKLKAIINAVRERVRTLAEVVDAVEYFYTDGFTYEEKGVRKVFQKEGVRELLIATKSYLSTLERFDVESVEAAYSQLREKLGVSAGRLIQATRLALTGRTQGPGLFEIMAILGQEKTLQRLERAITYLEEDENK